ncbi:hypothetical protein HII28_00420 [Planctomonas sp. JC2975]|uniref:hypothetical protein n=1 Tax=Planctomonas sp. JC2975 TaxID=2729626 RepID=UPI00147425E8|nr:hypothetical protein [Planctomonas sp. JC2975]NNC10349.1 hypothetical protein [Planctomonas sp. JC2975]
MGTTNAALVWLKWLTGVGLIVGLILLFWGMYLMGMSLFPEYVSTGSLMVTVGASLSGVGTLALFALLAALAVLHEVKKR